MIRDYHMHPQILQCPEKFSLYVQTALENGVEEICVTDHMPLIGSDAGDRIPHGKVEEYCWRVRETAEKYKGQLSVKLGIEIDYHPTVTDQIEAVLKAGDFDFVIGSSHLHVLPEWNAFRAGSTRNTYVEETLRNTIAAAKSGYFDAIAHLDLYHWNFSNPVRFPLIDDGFSEQKHDELIDRTLDTIREAGLYLELNPHLAASTGSVESLYPSASIVERALTKGMKFSYGSDSHTPDHVGMMLEEIRKHPVYGRALRIWEQEG